MKKIFLVTCVLHDKGILKFYRMFKLFIYRVYVHVCKIKYVQIKEYGVLINDELI